MMRPPRFKVNVRRTLSGLIVAALCVLSGCGGGAPANVPSPAAELAQTQAAAAGKPLRLSLDLGNGVQVALCYIPSGEFLMGSPAGEPGRQLDEQQQPISMPRPFYIGESEITQLQYSSVMDSNPSVFMGKDYPAENMTLADAQAFCKKVSESTRQPVRLPADAEWEYACRAGTATPFFNGAGEAALTEAGWFQKNSSARTAVVKQKKPNAWGLYDTHGNLWEWCLPRGQPEAAGAAVKGGSWMDAPEFCRSASFTKPPDGFKNSNIGFRIVVPLSQ